MKRPFIAFLSLLAIFALACGFLDSEIATVTYEEGLPVTIPIDANELCPEDRDCTEDSEPSPTNVTLKPIEVSHDVDIVEAADGDLKDIAQRLRSIEITSIDYHTEDNDLTFDIPELDFYVAPEGTDDIDDDGVIPLTTVPVIDAGEDDSGRAPVEEQNLEPASDLFKELKYALLAEAQPVIREGQPMPPSGDADYELTINIRITANPLD